MTKDEALKQEPVAYLYEFWADKGHFGLSFKPERSASNTPLYSYAPWVGLTHEEVAVVLTGDISLSTRLDELTPSWVDLVRIVEAKLKEKNRGRDAEVEE